MTLAPTYFYPNRMGRIVLLAMDEILGQAGVKTVLSSAHLADVFASQLPDNQDLKFPFEHLSGLQVGLESAYGSITGRGLAMRVGRDCFRYGLRAFGTELGLSDLSFRLLPLPAKLKVGTVAFAGLFNTFTDQRVRLEWGENLIYWHIERCPVCWERHSDAPCCHLAVGLLQEALYWVSGGKNFEVQEEKCIACGDSACTIVINQTPLG